MITMDDNNTLTEIIVITHVKGEEKENFWSWFYVTKWAQITYVYLNLSYSSPFERELREKQVLQGKSSQEISLIFISSPYILGKLKFSICGLFGIRISAFEFESMDPKWYNVKICWRFEEIQIAGSYDSCWWKVYSI